MFCPNCGTNLPDNSEFCSNCGHQLGAGQAPPAQPYAPNYAGQPYGQPYVALPLKSEILAIILAFIIPGTGHIYVGKFVRGLIILVAYVGLNLISVALLLSQFPNLLDPGVDPMGILFDSGSLIAISLLSMIGFVIWIVQLIDAYSQTKKYNDALRRTGQAPW